jgi:hypothetical protein
MKQITIGRILVLILWAGICGVIYSQSSLFTLNAAAYEPPAAPLNAAPQAVNDFYGVDKDQTLDVSGSLGFLGNDINVSQSNGLLRNDSGFLTQPLSIRNPALHGQATLVDNDGAFKYTPNSNFDGVDNFTYRVTNDPDGDNEFNDAVVTIFMRSIRFEVDNEDITKGNCASFIWFVRGDISLVEFRNFSDDQTISLSDSSSGDARVCPVKDTRYQLKVTWKNPRVKDDENKITIKVDDSVDSGGSSGSGSGGGAGSTTTGVGEPIPAVGAFLLATPVLITNVPGSPTTAGAAVPTPAGVLGEIKSLPETGILVAATPDPKLISIQPEDNNLIATQFGRKLWLTHSGNLGILLGIVIVGLILLAKFMRSH